MKNYDCDMCKKTLLLKFIKVLYNIKSADIARELYISKSVVSRYMVGERHSDLIDKYLIKKCFGIKI